LRPGEKGLGRSFPCTVSLRRIAAPIGRSATLIGRAYTELAAHEGFELSGHAAFTAILAIFPFLIFLAALAGFLGQGEGVENFMAATFRFVPPEVASALIPVVHDVTSQRRGDLATFGIVGAIWIASSGLEALRAMLNRSYHVRETRPFWRLKLQSILIVVFGAAIAVLVSLVIVFGPILFRAIHLLVSTGPVSEELWLFVRYGAATLLGTGSLIVLHMLLPNCSLGIGRVWAGAVVSVGLWLIMATLFSAFVRNFVHYSVIYGSLGGIILTLLFFYLSGAIFAYGAEVNAQLARGSRTRLKSPISS